MTEPITPSDLNDLTSLDIRGVSVIWSSDEDDPGRPVPDFFGCSEFEALGMARALVLYLEKECRIDPDDDEEDDGGWEVEAPNDSPLPGSPLAELLASC